jgi:hypothetical protein
MYYAYQIIQSGACTGIVRHDVINHANVRQHAARVIFAPIIVPSIQDGLTGFTNDRVLSIS